MNPPTIIDASGLFPLFAAAADGTLDDAGAAALVHALESSPEARRLWFLHQDMEIGLADWAAGRAADGAAVLPFPARSASDITGGTGSGVLTVSVKSRHWFTRPWRLAIVALVMTGVAVGIFLGGRDFPDASGIASISLSSMAEWHHEAPSAGTPLGARALELAAGAVQLDFPSGATVVFEGPGKLELLSPSAVRLVSGRLRARVPSAARGFTLEGTGFSVIDLGTEFGCAVPAGGASEVHVFEGSVELKPWDGEARVLPAHKAVAIDGAAIGEIAARPELFTSAEDLARRESSPGALAAEATRIMRDHPARLLHFRGDDLLPGTSGPTKPTVTTLDAEPGVTLSMHGGGAAAGRLAGTRALHFNGSTDHLQCNITGEYPALTLLAWVRVDASGRRHDLVTASGPFYRGEIAWYVYRNNAPGAGVHTPIAELPGRGWQTLHGSPGSVHAGDWHFLATVIDARAGTITHHVDGVVRGMAQFDLPGLLRAGPFLIGAPPSERNTRRQQRHFAGAIDEFAIIAAPLSAAEISRIHELGRPPGGQSISQ